MAHLWSPRGVSGHGQGAGATCHKLLLMPGVFPSDSCCQLVPGQWSVSRAPLALLRMSVVLYPRWAFSLLS